MDEHIQEEIDNSLVSIEALAEMSTATQRQLSTQGIGPYQRSTSVSPSFSGVTIAWRLRCTT